MLDDSVNYTGVDQEPGNNTGVDQEPGIFENEIKDEVVEKKIQEQERKLKELAPNLQELIDEINAEIALVDKVSDLRNSYKGKQMTTEQMTIEILARDSYITYLGQLKTRFILKLQEVSK